MQNAANLDAMVHALQQERDKAMIFMSKASPQTNSYLFDQYKYTDEVMVITPWPKRLDRNGRPEYKTKIAIQVPSYFKNRNVYFDFCSPPTHFFIWDQLQLSISHLAVAI